MRAACKVINRDGLRRLTLARIAEQVGISQKTLGYYYRFRDDIVRACFQDAIAFHTAMVQRAHHHPTLSGRVHSLVSDYFAALADVRCNRHPGFVFFGDLRAIGEDNLAEIGPAYVEMFRLVRQLFPASGARRDQSRNLWAHSLLSQLYWAVVWTRNLLPEDFPAAARHLADILLHGISRSDSTPVSTPPALASSLPAGALSHQAFLMAATRLINANGYRALSVDGISESLGVTKGSFYHYISSLDDLVVACFDRTFDEIRRAQNDAAGAAEPGVRRVLRCTGNLIDRQLSTDTELLRTSALTSVDCDLRHRISDRFDTLTRRFANMLNDGIADGSVRPCNIYVAAEMLTALINSAQETRFWAPHLGHTGAHRSYLELLQRGFVGVSAVP